MPDIPLGYYQVLHNTEEVEHNTQIVIHDGFTAISSGGGSVSGQGLSHLQGIGSTPLGLVYVLHNGQTVAHEEEDVTHIEPTGNVDGSGLAELQGVSTLSGAGNIHAITEKDAVSVIRLKVQVPVHHNQSSVVHNEQTVTSGKFVIRPMRVKVNGKFERCVPAAVGYGDEIAKKKVA